jgi:Glycosyl transferases group 1
VRAPALCRLLPRNVFYALAVVVEQTVLPVLGLLLRADLTLYPYNSVAVADVLSGRGRIVVHDLEQLNRGLSFSKLYYLACYRVLKWCNAPMFTISPLSQQRMEKSGLYGRGPITILPNTFYQFERLVGGVKPRPLPPRSILLCTGSTANKDIETLVADHLPKLMDADFHVAVLGLHKVTDAPRLAALDRYIASGRLRVCGRLSDREVARQYRSHALVWVHSRREGFGRCVVEGRLAGAHVICSDIPEFASLADEGVHLYQDAAAFMAAVEQLAAMERPLGRYQAYPYRELLRAAIRQGFGNAKEAGRIAALSSPAAANGAARRISGSDNRS